MSDGEIDRSLPEPMLSAARIAAELQGVKSMDDFCGREGVFARLFARTLEEMLETELTQHLGYARFASAGRNSGNSRNGYYGKTVRTPAGKQTIAVPRDREGEFSPQIVRRYAQNTNELEERIIGLYAKGISVRDIEETLEELYGASVSAATISAITDRVWSLVESWQSRPLAPLYVILYLDAIHLKIRQNSKVQNVAVHVVLGVDLDGQRDVLGHWIGDGAEGANDWLKVLADLRDRGVQDALIVCGDGLQGFEGAIHAVFASALVQPPFIHQIRNSLKYVSWKDRKAFVADP